MKKIISISVVILLAALFVWQAQAAMTDLPRGINIKAAGSSSVYFYGSDGTKHAYPDMATLLSWYPDKKFNIRTVAKNVLDSIPTGGNSMFKTGTLVKFGRLAAVYKSLKYGELCYATSANFADKNFGFGWRQKIKNALVRFSDYKITGPCPEESGLPSVCEVADPKETAVEVGGLRLNTYVKYVGPFTEAQKAEIGSSLSGIANVSSFRVWTFSNQTSDNSGTTSDEYIKIAVAMRLSFANEADLQAAIAKLTTSASGTAARPNAMPEIPQVEYQSCQVAGREGKCLTVDPTVTSDKLQEICGGQNSASTNTLENFGYSLICGGLLFPAQMAFIYSENLDLSMVMKVNMLMMSGNVFASTSSQGAAAFTYPDGFIMSPDQRDGLLPPYIDYLDQCKVQPVPTTTCASSGQCNLPPAPSTCTTGRFCQKTPCGPLANGGNSCATVEYACYQYCAQDSDCSGGQTCQQLECYEGDAIEKDLRKVCR